MTSIPLYIQITKSIYEMILKGELKYGQPLPPERELSKHFGVNRKTLRKALLLLEENKTLFRIQGRGTYLNKLNTSYDVKPVIGLNDSIRQQGMTPSNRLLYHEKILACSKYAKFLSVPKNCLLFRLVRLRLADGSPVALQSTFLRYDLLPDIEHLDFSSFSLYDILGQYKIQVDHVREQITPITIFNPEAKLLKRNEGLPGFMIEDISYDTYGQPLEYTKAYSNNPVITSSILL